MCQLVCHFAQESNSVALTLRAEMRKRLTRSTPGTGSVYWSQSEQRYVALLSLGRDENSVRVRKRFLGPRGDKSDEARLGLKDSVEQYRLRNGPRKRGARAHSRMTLREYLPDWLDGRDLSHAARATYGWAIDKYLVPKLGGRRLCDLSREELRTLLLAPAPSFVRIPPEGSGSSSRRVRGRSVRTKTPRDQPCDEVEAQARCLTQRGYHLDAG